MNSRARILFIPAIVIHILLAGCGGLSPEVLPEESLVNGTVTFLGGPQAWPDTIQEVRVVFFENQPLAPDSVLSAILNNRAAYSDTLQRRTSAVSYSIPISTPPRMFAYGVVAARVGDNLLKDWLMLALHTRAGSTSEPATITVNPGDSIAVDFIVDFQNLPPQPF
jgi:hypothetical protein